MTTSNLVFISTDLSGEGNTSFVDFVYNTAVLEGDTEILLLTMVVLSIVVDRDGATTDCFVVFKELENELDGLEVL